MKPEGADSIAGDWPVPVAAGGVIAAALFLGIAAQVWGPSPLPWSGRSPLETLAARSGLELSGVDEVRKLAGEGDVLVLDARPLREYDTGHLPGAISFPLETREAAFREWAAVLAPGQRVVVYCSGPHCDQALLLGDYLKRQAGARVALFAGGIQAWKAAGLPLE